MVYKVDLKKLVGNIIDYISNIKDIFILPGLFIFSIVILFASINKGLPGVDSGVFLYIGKKILNGEIPYKNIWDHKPPIIYFINALGLSFFNHSVWGVWLLEAISLVGACFLSYFLIKQIFGKIPAIFGTLIWLTSTFLFIEGGNFTEEYALPLQFLGLYLFYQVEKTNKLKLWLLIGALIGVLFFLRQNLIGCYLAILTYLFYRSILFKDYKRLSKIIVRLLIGIFAVTLIIFFYFFINNALKDFIDQVVIYNYIYTGAKLIKLFEVIDWGLQTGMTTKITLLALISWIELYAYLRLRLKKENFLQGNSFLYILLFLFPIELFIITISGRIYGHYFLCWLPVMGLLTACLIYSLKNRYLNLLIILLISLISLKTFIAAAKVLKNYQFSEPQIIKYLKENSKKNDTVLSWGNNVGVNFMSDRDSPSRYVYQCPFFTTGYSIKQDDLINSIKSRKPLFIVESKDPIVPPLDCRNYVPLNKQTLRDYICSNYYFKEEIERLWVLYQIKENKNINY